MKLIRYTLLAVSLLLSYQTGLPCGPYFEYVPIPSFFYDGGPVDDDLKKENLMLWQGLTSASIPLADIEEAVYTLSSQRFFLYFCSYDYSPEDFEAEGGNRFLAYILNTNDTEIKEFLTIAKDLEERRKALASPWYYPANRDNFEKSDYQDIIDRCREYNGTRLADRYALQLIRALFASRKYDECINEYEARLAGLAPRNLFRRMAERYIAGCHSRLGYVDKANEYFAAIGDFASIQSDDRTGYMAERNPDAPALLSYIGQKVEQSDTNEVRSYLPLVRKVIAGSKSHCKGDWYFLAAYIEGEFNGNYREAARLIRKAVASRFTSPDRADHARAYRMLTDAENLNTTRLLQDLQWIEQKITPENPKCKHWNCILGNIIQGHWTPNLMERKRHTLAMLLAGYYDGYFKSLQVNSGPANSYSNCYFQLMYAMRGDELVRVKAAIGHGDALQRHLERYACTDAEYLNELIGTIYIREESYVKAIPYLSKVSIEYQRSMGIYEYLDRDPFFAYSQRFDAEDPIYFDRKVAVVYAEPDNAKLRFARSMASLKKRRTSSPVAALDYAIGRRNSSENCWALTQYYRGVIPGIFEASTPWDRAEETALGKHILLYSCETQRQVEKQFNDEVKTILASTTDVETLALLNYRLRRFRTVARKYPGTRAGRMLFTTCDEWKDWAKS